MKKLAQVVMVVAGLLGASAWAQTATPGETKVVPARRTYIDFSDVVIECNAHRPDTELIVTDPGKRKFSNLVKVRENFRAELVKSAAGL